MTYDSDLEKARKLIKQIGLELQQDPEFGPNIIEPLKIQGVDEVGGTIAFEPGSRTAMTGACVGAGAAPKSSRSIMVAEAAAGGCVL